MSRRMLESQLPDDVDLAHEEQLCKEQFHIGPAWRSDDEDKNIDDNIDCDPTETPTVTEYDGDFKDYDYDDDDAGSSSWSTSSSEFFPVDEAATPQEIWKAQHKTAAWRSKMIHKTPSSPRNRRSQRQSRRRSSRPTLGFGVGTSGFFSSSRRKSNNFWSTSMNFIRPTSQRRRTS